MVGCRLFDREINCIALLMFSYVIERDYVRHGIAFCNRFSGDLNQQEFLYLAYGNLAQFCPCFSVSVCLSALTPPKLLVVQA